MVRHRRGQRDLRSGPGRRGHPLPGDFLYNPDYRLMHRQPLHSCHLDFRHPITGKAMHFEAEVPGDMRWISSEKNPLTPIEAL